ncbi:MAG: translation initiation factor Sui1 [Myxococcota bacterium]
MSRRRDGSLVYSSEHGRICPNCGLPDKRCACRANPRSARTPADPNSPKGDGIVRVRREVKGRHGKVVTTLTGIPVAEPQLRELARELKRCCGSGGTVKQGVIEIQGDHRDQLVGELEARGYEVKRAGG